MEVNNDNIGQLLKEGKDEAYVYIYRNCYPFMCKYAMAILKDFDVSREVAQGTIFKLWKSRNLIKPDQNINSYLITAVKNNALNYLRSTNKALDREAQYESSKDDLQTPDYFGKSELLAIINSVLDNENEERAKIFRMRKFDGMSTREVADELNINEKKVHYNISVVMEIMKEKLKGYIPVLLMMFQYYL